MKNFNSGEVKINLGIEFLRFILCLWVVVIHCSTIKKEHSKYLGRSFHVPTFILISFYFYYKILTNRIINKIIARFQRLLVPYILWPIIILISNNLLLLIFSIGQFNNKLTLYDLYIQLLTGARYHNIFWFQFNIIIISLFFTIISFIFKINSIKVFQLMGVASLYIHISMINYNIFNSYTFKLRQSLGSIIELTPLAVIGCIFWSTKILQYKIIYNINFPIMMFCIIYIFFRFDIFIYYPGFWYPNVFLNIFASITLFLLFGSLSLDNIKNSIPKIIIKIITKFTGGIYYLHIIYRCYLRKYSSYFNKKTYLGSFIIYIICYFNCFFGYKLFYNSKLKYLFI